MPASLHLLLLNAFADQDFVFPAVSTSATLCRHCYSGNIIKISGSSTKQLLYFGAGLHKFLLGEQADVQMGCTQSWAWCLMGLSGDAFCLLCVCPGVALAQLTLKCSNEPGTPVQASNWPVPVQFVIPTMSETIADWNYRWGVIFFSWEEIN